MSVKIMTLVWEYYPAGGGELLTALAYADHAHDDGNGIRPSVAYIARKTRQSTRTVQRYLTQMRKAGWLQVVRHSKGGRNRVTEYRINPLWITNPVKMTPFLKKEVERVTNDAPKGDTGGMKRVTPVSPQPSLTIIEPTTTSATEHQRPVDNLRWPPQLSKDRQASCKKILKGIPLETQQQILDEIAGLAIRGHVRHPIALLHKLTSKAKQGLFIPDAALEVERKRSAEMLATQQSPLMEPVNERPTYRDPLAKDHFAALKHMLQKSMGRC